MAGVKKEFIDVRTTAATKKDIQQLAKELETASDSVKQLVKGFQDLSQLKMAAVAKGAAENSYGLGAYNRGVNQVAKQRATDTARLGTQTAQAADAKERDLRATQKLMKTQEGLLKVQRAKDLILKDELKSVEKLTDRGRILEKQDLARVKSAEAQLRLNELMARRDIRNRAIKQTAAGSPEREALKRQAPAANAQIRDVRQEVQAADRLNALATSRLETLKQETAQKAEQAKFDRQAERQESQSLTSRRARTREATEAQRAERLNLEKATASVSRINNLQSLKILKLQTQNRLELESQRGNIQARQQAQALNTLLDDRIRKLQRANQVAKEAAKPTKDQMAGNAREMSMKRLFGDNGASLFAIQAGLVANYALMNQLRTGFQQAIAFTVELDSAMRNLQAIVRITDTDLVALKDSLIGISEETKFTAVEVANAAVTLGQAGFSTDEIKDSIRAVSLLATATGTELKNAVDIATSTLGVFNMESSQMGDVANILTEAVNTSKLNIEKLTLGLQYSGNIAAQSGVSFKELTSALGAMANAGIRSGSTLGTGMRQILIALQKPSKEFSGTLERLGLTMDDVNLETKGLYGALKNLRDAGFSSGDAIQSFEVRAAAAYNALSGNLDQMLSLQNAFQRTSASIQANATQMKSLSNQGKRLGSVLGSVVASGLDPMLQGFIGLTKGAADLFSWLRQFEGTLKFLTTGVAVAGLSSMLVYFGRMAIHLKAMVFGTQAMTAANLAAASSFRVMTVAMISSPFVLVAAAITAIGAAFYFLGNRSTDAAKALETAQTALDRSVGSAEKMQKSLVRVDNTLEDLTNRYDLLSEGGALLDSVIIDIQKQFVDMGRDADNVGDNVVDLIKTMRDLRMELSKEYEVRIGTSVRDLESLRTKTETSRREAVAALSGSDYVTQANARGAGAFAGQGSAEVQGLAQPLFNPGSSLNDVGTSLSTLRQKQAGLESLVQDGKAQAGDEAVIAYLDFLIESGEGIKNSLISLENLKSQRNALIEQGKIAADGANPAVFTLMQGANEIATDVQGQMTGGLAGKTAQERTRAVAQRFQALDKEIEAERRSLEVQNENGVIQSKETYEQISRQLSEASAMATSVFRAVKEESDKVVEKLSEFKVKGAEAELTKLANELSEAQGLEAIGLAMAAQKLQLERVREAEIALVKSQGLDPDVEAATLIDTNRQFDERSSAIDEAGAGQIQKILDLQKESTAESKNQLAIQQAIIEHGENSLEVETLTLEAKKAATADSLRKAGVEEGFIQFKLQLMQQEFDLAQKIQNIEANKDLRQQIAQRKEENRIALVTLLLGEDSVVVTKMRDQAEYNALKRTLESSDAAEDLKDKLLAATKAGQALGRADMSSGINKAIGAVGVLLGKLRTAASVFGKIGMDSQRRAEVLAIEGATIGNPVERAGLMAEAEQRNANIDAGNTGEMFDRAAELAGTKARENETTAQANAAAQEAYDKANKPDTGGGGRGRKNKKDPAFEALQNQLSNRIGAATISLDTGGDPARAYVEIQSALERANVEVEKRERLITSIAAKQSRSVAEEERLKQLITEHNQLRNFAKEEEQKILWLKESQGQAQVNLSELVRDWSRESLVGVVALEEGLKGVLDNLLGGFGQLFTDMVSGVKSAKQAFKDFAISVVQSLLKVIAKLIAIKILKAILEPIAGGSGKLAGFAQEGLDFLSNKEGGRVQRKAGGGRVGGNLARDSVPHFLMPDEYVLRASAAKAIGFDKLNQINAMGNTSIAGASNSPMMPAPTTPMESGSVNVYVVSPDQKPVPGPRDIIAIMDDHISRGGSTKKLIKSVSMGEL